MVGVRAVARGWGFKALNSEYNYANHMHSFLLLFLSICLLSCVPVSVYAVDRIQKNWPSKPLSSHRFTSQTPTVQLEHQSKVEASYSPFFPFYLSHFFLYLSVSLSHSPSLWCPLVISNYNRYFPLVIDMLFYSVLFSDWLDNRNHKQVLKALLFISESLVYLSHVNE